MPKRFPFFSKETGSMAEKDNNYALVINDDGHAWIDYTWDYTNPYKSGQSKSGSEVISLAEYLKNGEGLDKLRALMAEHKVAVPG